MNAFWSRANAAGALQPLLKVVETELILERDRKTARVATLEALAADSDERRKQERNDGMTRDEAKRILDNVEADLDACALLLTDVDPKEALDGERSFSGLYRVEGQESLWKPGRIPGQKPVDVLVVREQESKILLGDCKFGMKSEQSSMVRNVSLYDEAFGGKIRSVSAFIKAQDDVVATDEVLLIVTSDLAPLLRNRMSDYALEESSHGIPYEHIRVCSVGDLKSVVSGVSLT